MSQPNSTPSGLMYGVPTKRLNEQVKRNSARFPPDFMFALTPQEKAEVVTDCGHLGKLKFSKTLPFAFSQHSSIQAANVLASPQAIEMGVYVVCAFVRLREMIVMHKELVQRTDELEQTTEALSLRHDTFAHNTRAVAAGVRGNSRIDGVDRRSKKTADRVRHTGRETSDAEGAQEGVVMQ